MKSDVIQNCVEKECGRSFILSVKEVNHFQSKGYILPRRCQKCRANNRAARGESPLLKGGIFHPQGGNYQHNH